MRAINQDVILETNNIYFFNDCLWFTEYQSGDLYYYDLCIKKAELFCKNPEKKNKRRLYGSIIEENGYFYLIPFFAEKMYKIGLSNRSIEAIDLNKKDNVHVFEQGYFSSSLSAHIYNGKIYIIPTQVSSIIEYNCANGQVSYFGNWEKKDYIKDKDDLAICRKSMLVKDKIYMPYCKGNYVAIFDLKTKNTEVHAVGSKDCNYSAICLSGNNFWLAPRKNGKIVRWNSITNSVKEFEGMNNGNLKGFAFGDIVALENSIFMIPVNSNAILSINNSTGVMRRLDYGDVDIAEMCCCKHNETIYMVSLRSGKLYIYNTKNEIIEKRYIIAPEDIANDFRKTNSKTYEVFQNDCYTGTELFCEDYNEAFRDYFRYIRQSNREYGNEWNKSGRIIWQTLK